ncbi:MAG: tRNA uridine-5-carboxymethylaminomethyl(34) synthesis GTPase MnmE [Bacilli bacterium]
MVNDTITAISTALGIGAISIIRVSGKDAIENVNKIFKGTNLKEVKTHTIHYGYIINDNKIIDEVLVSIMLAPKTFTRENVVEINTHGGIATTTKILEILLTNNCRLAEPGEFTKRAFLNGRIDLTQAEGVMNLINSKTQQARALAINELKGCSSKLIKDLRKNILEILANIEVNIDYPEYNDIELITNDKLKNNINNIKLKLDKILRESINGKIIKEGITVSIIGKPNVGKSSLLNNLINEKKAIVTDIAGTTRDCVEGTLIIEGVLFNFIDTAGIRKTNNKVESIGVQKSLDLIDKSQLILYLLNNNEKLKEEEIKIIEKLKTKNHIIVINKTDLENKLDLKKLKSDYIKISIKENKGIDELKSKIKEIFNLEKIITDDINYLTGSRNIAILKQCILKIEDINQAISDNVPTDIIEIDIKQIWDLLGKIIGQTYEDELINQLFSQFCLGK